MVHSPSPGSPTPSDTIDKEQPGPAVSLPVGPAHKLGRISQGEQPSFFQQRLETCAPSLKAQSDSSKRSLREVNLKTHHEGEHDPELKHEQLIRESQGDQPLNLMNPFPYPIVAKTGEISQVLR